MLTEILPIPLRFKLAEKGQMPVLVISSINQEQGDGVVLRTVRLKLVLICQLCCLWTAASSIQLQAGPNSSLLLELSSTGFRYKPRVNLGIGAMMIAGF